MAWIDTALLALIVISMLVGLWRGFVKEAFSLGVWIAAFLVAYQFSEPTSEFMSASISLPSARIALAFGGLFVAVILVGGLLTFLVGKLVETTGLTGTDRLLGGIFGACRGVILILILIMLAGLTPIPRDPWWAESFVIQAALPYAEWAATLLPDSIEQYIEFYPEEVVEAPA